MTGTLSALLAGVAVLPAWAAQPTPTPVSRPCQEALNYEKTAASDTISPQGAYDAAVAGLEANKRCTDEPMRLTREAYLLSMRAASEKQLGVGNWQRDLTRAQMLLANCANRPDVTAAAAADCRRQARYNEDWMKKAVATPVPMRPVPTPTPAPSPGGSGAGVPRPVIAPPPTPNPSPRP